MKKTYTLNVHTEPNMAVTRFKWQTDIENNALMSWVWPKSPDVKYMLAATTTEDPEDPLAWLMQEPHRHSVVTRNLSAHYEVPIGDSPKRYIFAPAYLQGKGIAVYGPAFVTDLLYAKVHAEVRITNRPLPLSPYKRVGFSLSFSEEHGKAIAGKALRYALYEYTRLVGSYPLDETLMAGGYMYIKKTQHIRFIIEDKYEHLIALV
jgi:hypothetical protein